MYIPYGYPLGLLKRILFFFAAQMHNTVHSFQATGIPKDNPFIMAMQKKFLQTDYEYCILRSRKGSAVNQFTIL
jgi:hypothetical protein